MQTLGWFLLLISLAGCSLFSVSRTQQEGAVLELYGTFHAMGITVLIDDADDPNENAAATVEYRTGDEPYRTGFPLSRINNSRFVGSLFWLDPGNSYDVRITFHDPDGDPLSGMVLQASASTRAEIHIPTPNHSWIVSPTGSGTDCSLLAPCALSEGIHRAYPGDEVVLQGGVYYQGEITLPRSGAPDAPIVIRGERDAEVVLDGADPLPLRWTALGAGLYQTTTAIQEINLVAANGVRLYPYQDLASLQTLRHKLPGFYVDGLSLYVHLTAGGDPNHAVMVVSRYNRGFDVDQDSIYFLNLTFRHYGQGSEARAIYLDDASNNLVQDSTFALNNGGITIRDASHRNVIQDNEFYDTIFAWSWDAVKATGFLERGGVYFGGTPDGRGNVIRRNRFHDYFDGFDVCPGEPNPDEPLHQTNETDVYDNVVYNVGDDGVQVDGWCSNMRLWNNTFHDVLVGISFAPTVGGPVYVIRNLIYRFGAGNSDYNGRSFKFNSSRNNKSGPIYLLHNTADAGLSDAPGIQISHGSSYGWALIYARNNTWTSKNYVLRNSSIEYPVDFDYNNLWNSNNDILVRWGDDNYSTLVAFQRATGQETNGINVNPGFLQPQAGGYALAPSSSLIDAGVLLPGINDDYIGAAPDIGVFETTAVALSQVHLPIVYTP